MVWVDDGNAGAQVESLTGARAVDVILECSGNAAAISLGLGLVKRNGKYTQFGLSGSDVSVPFEQIAYKQLSVKGVFAHTWPAWEKALRYMATGQVDAEKLISQVLPITEWKQAYEMVENKEGVKILLVPSL